MLKADCELEIPRNEGHTDPESLLWREWRGVSLKCVYEIWLENADFEVF